MIILRIVIMIMIVIMIILMIVIMIIIMIVIMIMIMIVIMIIRMIVIMIIVMIVIMIIIMIMNVCLLTELSVALAASDLEGGAFPAEVHPPPSYEEAVAGTTADPRHATSTRAQAHAQEGRARVQGRDNPAFSARDETGVTAVSVIASPHVTS